MLPVIRLPHSFSTVLATSNNLCAVSGFVLTIRYPCVQTACTVVRDSELTNIPFYISSSGRLCRPFNHKILSVALLRLRFCSIRDDKSNLNLSVKSGTSVNSKSLSIVRLENCIVSKSPIPLAGISANFGVLVPSPSRGRLGWGWGRVW